MSGQRRRSDHHGQLLFQLLSIQVEHSRTEVKTERHSPEPACHSLHPAWTRDQKTLWEEGYQAPKQLSSDRRANVTPVGAYALRNNDAHLRPKRKQQRRRKRQTLDNSGRRNRQGGDEKKGNAKVNENGSGAHPSRSSTRTISGVSPGTSTLKKMENVAAVRTVFYLPSKGGELNPEPVGDGAADKSLDDPKGKKLITEKGIT